jgi:hypothetical protein
VAINAQHSYLAQNLEAAATFIGVCSSKHSFTFDLNQRNGPLVVAPNTY